MTNAYAIKGPDGNIDLVLIDTDIEETWYEYIKSVEGRVPTSGSIVKDIQYWKDEGFTCVPVTVSEFEEPLSPELAKKYPLDRRLRIFIEQLMLADDVAKEFDYEEAKRLHRELVDRLTAVSEKG